MREIKFRAWDGVNMVGACCVDVSYFQLQGGRSCGNFMQFTGLHDKNGKEIYEGDVVQVIANPNHGRGTIRFGAYRLENFTKHDRQRNHYGFYILFKGKGLSLIHSMITPEGYGSSTHSVEVIGNIHQNPELREVKP